MRLSRFLVCLALCSAFASQAFAQNGIPSDGRDYYMAYIQSSNQCSALQRWRGIYALVSSYYDANVTISYFDRQSGKEIQGPTYSIKAKNFKQIPLDPTYMALDTSGEVPEYAACHIHASKPVNCSYYSTGPGEGGMYLGLPTGALGKHYVVCTLPANDGYGASRSRFGCQAEGSSSMMAIIAIKDNTVVTITPNATSLSRQHIGKSSGWSASGLARPFQITLERGQVYVLKSEHDSQDPDMSGSIVDADQPVGVIAAQEDALNGESQYAGNGGDQRDLSLEMMVPVDYWTSDGYTSIPMMDSPGSPIDDPSAGDMFRVYTYDTTSTMVDFWNSTNGNHRYNVSQFQYPPTTINNVVGGINAGSENGQKIFVEQYDYRQQTLSEPFPAPSSMNVVPMGRWRNSYMWSVPDDKNQVHKRRYINVIARADQIGKIKIWTNGSGPKALTSLPSAGGSYSIPNTGGKVVGRRYEITPGAFYATADSAFGLTQYGLLGLDPDFDLGDNDDDDYYFEYAAPVGQSFAIDGAARPDLSVVPFCSHWDVHVHDILPIDGGVAQIEILNDPQGVLKRKPGTDSGYVSTNVHFNPDNFTVIPGDTVVDAQIAVMNPLQDAELWLWVLNVAGKDTLIHLTYKAPSLALAKDYATSGIDSAQFMKIPLGQDSCSRFVFKNTGKPGDKAYTVTKADFLQGGQGVFRVSGTIPALPATLQPGDSVIIDLCFQTNTPAHVYFDTLHITTDCPDGLAPVVGSSTYPLINATDWDFGTVPIGDTVYHTVDVQNVGTANLVLTTDWVLHDSIQFSFADAARLPMTLKPNERTQMKFSFHPVHTGADSTWQDWGTNLVAPFEHQLKDNSWLWGRGIEPGLRWNRPDDSLKTICDAPVEDTLWLLNPTVAPDGKTVTVDSVGISGPTAAEWTIVQSQNSYTNTQSYGLEPEASNWYRIRFSPDLSKPLPAKYQDRQDTLYAYGDNGTFKPYVALVGHVDAADLTASTTSLDLGIVQPGQTTNTKTVTISNPGTAPLIIKSITIDNPAFVIVSGPKVGDVIAPGGSADITVNATVTVEGSINGQMSIEGETNCPPKVLIAMIASTRFVSVKGSNHEYAPTYVCRRSAYDLFVTSTGSDTVVLKSIDIVDDASMPNGSLDFHFPDGSRSLTVNQVMVRGTTYSYNVVYEPTIPSLTRATVRYNYDTARNPGLGAWSEDETLTGPGLQEHETLTAAKNDAAPDHYMATTAGAFDVPIRFTKTMPATADAKELAFDFTFRRDLFHWINVTPATGYGIPNVSSGTINGNLETRRITVVPAAGSSFTSADALAIVSMQLMVARDTNSDFEVSNAVYLDGKGDTACYILHDEVPGAFTPIDLCGDKTIRGYMQTDQLTFDVAGIGPNPASSTVDVKIDVRKDKSPITIEIFDALGNRVKNTNTVMTTGLHTRSIDVSTLRSGEYNVRVSSANGEVQTRKLVIEK